MIREVRIVGEKKPVCQQCIHTKLLDDETRCVDLLSWVSALESPWCSSPACPALLTAEVERHRTPCWTDCPFTRLTACVDRASDLIDMIDIVR
jgi:hypothetical protein